MMLFSRIVVLKSFRPRVMAITAMGMDAVTVSPALMARYVVEQPKTIPKKHPSKIDLMVSSAMLCSGATYGLNFSSSVIVFLFYSRRLTNITHVFSKRFGDDQNNQ